MISNNCEPASDSINFKQKVGAVKHKLKKDHSLEPDTTIARAYFLMEALNRKILPVTSEGDVVGVLSLKDIETLVQRYSEGKKLVNASKVGDFMRGPVRAIDAQSDLAKVIRSMLSDDTHALLVQESGETLGILTRDNLLESFAKITDEARSTVLDLLKSLS